MARGAPDDYNLRVSARTYPVADLAELAVRLGSIVVFDRRGDVVYSDNMLYGTRHWDTATGGAGSSVAADNAQVFRGVKSLALTAGAAALAYAGIIGWFAYPPTTKIGAEIAFALDPDQGAFFLRLGVYTGSTYVQGAVKVDLVEGKLQYESSSGAWTDLVASLSLNANDRLFHILKLVIDLDAEEYVRCLLDSTEVDMADIACYAPASAVNPYLRVEITAQSDGSHASTCYVDCFILTQDEP